VLLPGDRRPTELAQTLAGWPQLHARLALVGPAGVPSLACVAQRRGPLVYVSARMRLRLPSALVAAGGATRVLVVPGVIGDREPAFAVAGCRPSVLRARRVRVARDAAREPA
jgi:hypothetical protein